MHRKVLTTIAAIVLTACAHANPLAASDPIESVSTAPTPAPANELLSRLVGRWVLTGDIAGQSTVHDVEATWVLQGNYVRIEEVSRETGENGLPEYQATIFVGWLESEDRYVCLWLDNTEVASGEVTCSASPTHDAFPFEFRDAQGALIFTNTFTYSRVEDAWQWRMDNIRDGQASTFGLVTLRRP